MNGLITIHGIDGTGKTTTVRNIVEKLGSCAINFDDYKEGKTYPKNPYTKSSTDDMSVENVCYSYFQSISHHSNQVHKLITNGKTIVKARYIEDLRAHFSHLGVSEQFLDSCEQEFKFYQPNLKVILILDEKTRRTRINQRGILDSNDKEVVKDGSRLDYFQKYLIQRTEKPNESILIDSGANTEIEIVRIILDLL